MIEVIINDRKSNMSRVITYPKDLLLAHSPKTMQFFNMVNIMLGEFLRDLREHAKEDKP